MVKKNNNNSKRPFSLDSRPPRIQVSKKYDSTWFWQLLLHTTLLHDFTYKFFVGKFPENPELKKKRKKKNFKKNKKYLSN